MLTATVHVIKGAPEETELAALVAVLHILSRPGTAATSAPTPGLSTRPRRAPWTRPRRRSSTPPTDQYSYER